ncbi:hypothetical protein COCMIDRAFT_96611 [Bipolaris oryzae ATCC 44560]|uniref:Uncharacterized protein n=1 Tax=Bipolaris oryzae ATCC 44560 TaxID=930090 RepID=W6ZCA9_COCMI|nr:uncharacterized protein COCMIDRAFT_96611 [Bipolaris oryzae ATCC 44560]EUC45064.1 hypothetical protein COCMIDRAFT_96611 [Bipolaris oryzae ATCC 44560]
MRITAILWAAKARTATPIPRRMQRDQVRKLLGLSDQQWPIFLRISLAVCQDYAGAKLSDISPPEKEEMMDRIRSVLHQEGLPPLDDEAIEWRISKCLPELRVKKRDIEHCHSWEATTETKFPRQLLREAVLAHIDKIPTKNLCYWTQIPQDVRQDVVEEANRRLAEKGMPVVDEAALLYRLRKYMNHWIKSGLVQDTKESRRHNDKTE